MLMYLQRCQHSHASPDLLVCSFVYCDGDGGGCVPLRTYGQAEFLRHLKLLAVCQYVIETRTVVFFKASR
jgi:hypothetical protein